MKEDIKVEELIRLIYKEVKNNKEEIQNVKRELSEKLDTKVEYLDKKIDTKVEYLDKKIDTKVEYLDKKIDTKVEYLDKKIDNTFKYLDEKIDTTKTTLVSEIAEEFKNFSELTTKLIKNLEKKIDNEINERKSDISKVKEFNKIMLSDLGSRISILEEENEKYNIN